MTTPQQPNPRTKLPAEVDGVSLRPAENSQRRDGCSSEGLASKIQNPESRTKLPAEVGGVPRRPSVCTHTLQPRGTPPTVAPTVCFKTIGCRLNQAETDQIEEQFQEAGYKIVAAESECDVAIINTCTITHGAERDSARWARRLRRKGAKTVILAGCAVVHNGEKLKELTGADIIANQKEKYHLLELLKEFELPIPRHAGNTQHRTSNLTDSSIENTTLNVGCSTLPTQNLTPSLKLKAQVRGVPCRPSWCSPPASLCEALRAGEAEAAPAKRDTPNRRHTRALIKAQDGCNFRCSYCIVPDTRGLPYSVPIDDVLRDINKKANQGFKEIVITGANIGCYNDHGNTLINLLEKAEEIQGIERIRISSIESTTAELHVIDFMATSSKLCHFLHLPLQSGDDQTLKQMRRHYTADQYRKTVEYATSRIPNLGLGTDVIVGFPGESDQSFQNTLSLINDLPFTNLHVFSYSKRRGTPAADMPNQIDPKIKKERSAQLIALGKSKRAAFAKSFIGKEVSVLIEKNDETGKATGWTEEYLPTKIFNPNAKPNQIIRFTPTTTDGDILTQKPKI